MSVTYYKHGAVVLKNERIMHINNKMGILYKKRSYKIIIITSFFINPYNYCLLRKVPNYKEF